MLKVVRITACWAVCLSGCLLQNYYISQQYFKYETVTQLTINRPDLITPPNFVTCFGFLPVYKQLNKTADFDNMTIAELLANIPTVAEVIDFGKRHDSFSLMGSRAKNFSDDFLGHRFMKQQKFCYSLQLRKDHTFSAASLFNGYQGPYFWHIEFKAGKLANSFYQRFYLHPHFEKQQYGSPSNYAEHDRLIIDNATGHSMANYIVVTYQRYYSQLLPPPYKTNCIKYAVLGFQSRGHCFEQCLNKATVETLGRVPFTTVKDDLEFGRYRYISKAFYDVEENKHKYVQAESTCRKKCSFSDCVKARPLGAAN